MYFKLVVVLEFDWLSVVPTVCGLFQPQCHEKTLLFYFLVNLCWMHKSYDKHKDSSGPWCWLVSSWSGLNKRWEVNVFKCWEISRCEEVSYCVKKMIDSLAMTIFTKQLIAYLSFLLVPLIKHYFVGLTVSLSSLWE